MKTLVIVGILFITGFTSCKKKDLTQTELVGTWEEIQPCVRDSNACYTLQFTNNNKVYVSTPFVDTGSYELMGDNTIKLDSSVSFGPGVNGSQVFQVVPGGKELIIKKFYTLGFSMGMTLNPVYDIHLNKL